MSNKEHNKNNENNKKSKFININNSNIYKILCIVLMLILIFTLGAWGLTMYSRNLAYDAYEDLITQVNENVAANASTQTVDNGEAATEDIEATEVADVTDTEVIEENNTEENNTEEVEDVLTNEELIAQLGLSVPEKKLDWKKLHEINPDIYAWIYIPNTKVEYPVLQHPSDDNYYLNRNMDGSYGKPGCIFTQSLNHKDFLDLNTVVYGHNMRDGEMFRTLHNYEDKKFFEENPYVYIYTEDHVLIYEVFAAYVTDDSHILNTNDFTSVEGYAEYLEKAYGQSKAGNVRQDVSVNAMNRILTLSTCTGNSSKRYLVQGVLLNDPILYGLEDAVK